LCLLPFALGLSATAQYSLDWFTLDDGSATSAGSGYSLTGTIGQPDAGAMTGGNYALAGGFWGLYSLPDESSGIEGDVSPRAQANGVVSVTDWVQVGRFVAGLDAASVGAEFQRADCAPRATLGDGRLTVSDWVQAGRYAAGLDSATAAAGPTSASLNYRSLQNLPWGSACRPCRCQPIDAFLDGRVGLPNTERPQLHRVD
jgi:hypothetical protein